MDRFLVYRHQLEVSQKLGFLNALDRGRHEFHRREVNVNGVRGYYTLGLKTSHWTVKFRRFRRIVWKLRTLLLRRLLKCLDTLNISGDYSTFRKTLKFWKLWKKLMEIPDLSAESTPNLSHVMCKCKGIFHRFVGSS